LISFGRPSHGLPKEIKHYYKKDYYDRTDDLAHPKLEAAYQVSRTDETLHYTPENVERLKRELDEAVYAVLHDAGLGLRAGETYVEDAIFENTNHHTDATIVDLDLTQIRHEQEAVVYRHLVKDGGLSPVEQEALGTLVTDGGEVAPSDIAEAHERHIDSVYRALGRMHDLVEHEYGSVSLKSTYVAELVNDAITQAEAAVERATLASAKAVNAADRGLDEQTSAFIAWCEKHGVNYDEDAGDRMRIKLGVVSSTREVRRILREGLRLWEAMKKDSATFRSASLTYQQQKGSSGKYASNDDRLKTYHIPNAWKYL